MSTNDHAHAGATDSPSSKTPIELAGEAFNSGDFNLAEEIAERLHAGGDRSSDCLQILGSCRAQRGDHRGAADVFGELVDLLTPGFSAALAALGHARAQLGDLDEALTAYQRASALLPEDGTLAHSLGNILHARGQLGPARVHYERAAGLLPSSPAILNDLGSTFAAQREFASALERFEEAAALAPDAAGPTFNAAQALFSLGEADRSLTLLRKAERLGHGPDALAMQAVMIPGCDEVTEMEILETRRRYSVETLPPLTERPRPAAHSGGPDTRLRIGYVSAFFPDRNWMKPMWGAINNHDRARFEIHLFSDAVLRESPAGYEAHPDDHIHTIKGLDDTSAADCIRQQGVDVLVDLNGYSYVPRLGLYPLRAAPVQVAWAGMYATSGQDSFDALMTDGVVVPEGEEPYYSEPIRRLPGTHLAFDVRYPVPPLAPAPAKAAGKVTFGCLAPLYKLHPTVLSAYAEILKRTPTSRLLFRNRGLNNASNRTWLTKRMEALGIPADRLVLLGGAEHYLFLETYNQIDIALDTFPYNGGTSTMESLWQGVPCLTFRGRRLIERQSTTLILAAGLGEFVATDRQGFIDLACKVALDARTQEFTDRRLTSRTRLADSQACNTPLLSRSMEKIYVETFEQICGGV